VVATTHGDVSSEQLDLIYDIGPLYFILVLFYFLDNEKICDHNYMILHITLCHRPGTLEKRLKE